MKEQTTVCLNAAFTMICWWCYNVGTRQVKLTIFILPLFCRSRHEAIKPDHKKEREVDNHVSSQSSTKDLVQ